MTDYKLSSESKTLIRREVRSTIRTYTALLIGANLTLIIAAVTYAYDVLLPRVAETAAVNQVDAALDEAQQQLQATIANLDDLSAQVIATVSTVLVSSGEASAMARDAAENAREASNRADEAIERAQVAVANAQTAANNAQAAVNQADTAHDNIFEAIHSARAIQVLSDEILSDVNNIQENELPSIMSDIESLRDDYETFQEAEETGLFIKTAQFFRLLNDNEEMFSSLDEVFRFISTVRAPLTWRAAAFENGWDAHPLSHGEGSQPGTELASPDRHHNPESSIDRFGIVRIRGALATPPGLSGEQQSLAFVLPEAHRPSMRLRFLSTADSASGLASIDVWPDGRVIVRITPQHRPVSFVSLDGITFSNH